MLKRRRSEGAHRRSHCRLACDSRDRRDRGGTRQDGRPVVDDADDFLCGKIFGMNPDGVEGLTATGFFTTPDTVGVDGVPGTTSVCTSNGLTSTPGVT
jgi:hypothetical protein